MKFAAYIKVWKQQCRLKIGDGWKLCQDQVLEAHILPHLGRKEMNSIKPGDVSDVLTASRLKGHSENQQKKIYMVMSKVFKDAVNFSEVILRSPVKKDFHKPTVHKVEQASLDEEQLIILLEYVYGHPVYGLPVWIQCLSGIRVSEIQALEVGDLNFKTDEIEATKKYDRHVKKVHKFTKNKGWYFPPMPPKLKEYLKKFAPESGLVCPGFSGKILNEKTYDDFLKRTFKALKFPITSSHGLRHTCARYYATLGASDEQIQQLLGHKWLVSTKTYIHRSNEPLKLIAKKIA